jgi:hypothetical protein
MTDEQLITEAYKKDNKDKFAVADFYIPYDVDVISKEHEWWQDVTLDSVLTFEEAEEQIMSFALKQRPESYTFEYIGDNDYYYEFRLVYTDRSYLTNELIYNIVHAIVYKESAKYITFNNQDGYYAEIRDLNRDSVKDLLDLMLFDSYLKWYGSRIIYRELAETDASYIYTYYGTYRITGDWGVNNSVVLEKAEIKVNKKNGTYDIGWRSPDTGKVQKLKEVVIPGTAR